jgi:hypothetical protein
MSTVTRRRQSDKSATPAPAALPPIDLDRLDPRLIEADGQIEAVRHAVPGHKPAFLLGWYRNAYSALYREALDLRAQVDRLEAELSAIAHDRECPDPMNPLW